MKPQVSIVLVTWNSGKYIQECLQCITNQTVRNYEIIVVDNDSHDESVEYITQHYPQIKVIQNKKNLGFCKASNQGIQASQGEFILILNPDVFPIATFLEELVNCLSQNRHYGAVGGKLLLFKEGKQSRIIDSTGLFPGKSFRARDRGNLTEDKGQYDKEGMVFALCGAAVLFRRAALEQVKVAGEYFDEDFFAYYDDLDLGWRIQLSGYENGYTPKAVAYHIRGGSGVGAKFFQKRPAMQRLTLRNRYFMLIKNLTLLNLLYFLPFLVVTEGMIFLYMCTRAPYLLTVYRDVSRNLLKFWRKRSLIQQSRIRNSRYIRHWVKNGSPWLPRSS